MTGRDSSTDDKPNEDTESRLSPIIRLVFSVIPPTTIRTRIRKAVVQVLEASPALFGDATPAEWRASGDRDTTPVHHACL